MELANNKLRLINFLIDFVIIVIVCMLLFYLFSRVYFSFGLNEKIADGEIVRIDVLILVVMLLYYLLLESLTYKTVAKYITKTKVVNKEGGNPTFLQIVLRTLFRIIVPLDVLTYIFGSKGWHDKFSSTEVIKDV